MVQISLKQSMISVKSLRCEDHLRHYHQDTLPFWGGGGGGGAQRNHELLIPRVIGKLGTNWNFFLSIQSVTRNSPSFIRVLLGMCLLYNILLFLIKSPGLTLKKVIIISFGSDLCINHLLFSSRILLDVFIMLG